MVFGLQTKIDELHTKQHQIYVLVNREPWNNPYSSATSIEHQVQQALVATMYRVFSTVLRKSPGQLAVRGMSSEASDALKWEERKLQMQLQHELTLKKLELDQKRGLEHLGVSRDTANLLTVSGTCLVVVASGAWLISHLLTDTRVNLVSLQKDVFNNNENFRSLISGGHYPEKGAPEQPGTKK